MSGPAAKPTRLKIIEGNPGHQRLNRSEPKPKPVAPSRPVWLLPEAKREWVRVSRELERLGLLTLVDRAALAGYCQGWALAAQADAILRREGLTFTTPNGYVQQRPEVAIAQKSWQLMKAFAVEFGLTPASRSRISVPEPDDDLGGLLD